VNCSNSKQWQVFECLSSKLIGCWCNSNQSAVLCR